MKQIFLDPDSVANLFYLPALLRLGYKPDNLCNLGRVLVGFNGLQTNSLGKIVFPVSVGPAIALIPLTVIGEPLCFNAILGAYLDLRDEGITVFVPPNAKFLDSTWLD